MGKTWASFQRAALYTVGLRHLLEALCLTLGEAARLWLPRSQTQPLNFTPFWLLRPPLNFRLLFLPVRSLFSGPEGSDGPSLPPLGTQHVFLGSAVADGRQHKPPLLG